MLLLCKDFKRCLKSFCFNYFYSADSMGAFVISKRFNGDFKFVFTSRKGKTIFTSPGYENKADCEQGIDKLKNDIAQGTYVRYKAANNKYFFKLKIDDSLTVISRKYSTELRLQKGMDEISLYAAKSEILDFSENDLIFGEVEGG